MLTETEILSDHLYFYSAPICPYFISEKLRQPSHRKMINTGVWYGNWLGPLPSPPPQWIGPFEEVSGACVDACQSNLSHTTFFLWEKGAAVRDGLSSLISVLNVSPIEPDQCLLCSHCQLLTTSEFPTLLMKCKWPMINSHSFQLTQICQIRTKESNLNVHLQCGRYNFRQSCATWPYHTVVFRTFRHHLKDYCWR